MIRKISIAVAGAALAIFGVASAASASTQFTARVEGSSILLAQADLHAGEVIHLGLDGEAFRVTVAEHNGGGDTLAWVSPVLPVNEVGKTVLFTS